MVVIWMFVVVVLPLRCVLMTALFVIGLVLCCVLFCCLLPISWCLWLFDLVIGGSGAW